MSVIETHIKNSIEQALKNALIGTKYTDEPISMGQAVVT